MRLAAGFGCRRGCPVEQLEALLEQTLRRHGLHAEMLVAFASLDRKADEPGLLALAARWRLPLLTFSAAQLQGQQGALSQRSAVAFEHTGCHGVAESSALAQAHCLGGSPARLRVTRQVLGGATLALAEVGAGLAPQACPPPS
jgi:cobalt-precorrin 5A hydrolase